MESSSLEQTQHMQPHLSNRNDPIDATGATNMDRCKATVPKCGRCAESHETRECPGTSPDKCAACSGAHKVTSPTCALYLKEKEQKEQQRQVQTPLCQ